MTTPADTIVAVATPFGEGAIALLRLSGPEALTIADQVCVLPGGKSVSALRPKRLTRATMLTTKSSVLDHILVAVYRAPVSYTGEDVVEFTCHGGILLTRRALESLLAAGARAAGPGEFTQRAFLHGKMELTQAEAVMDLISAGTDLALRAAAEQLEGRLGQRVLGLREDVLSLVAHVEAYIDFPDEDIDPDTGAALLARFEAVWSGLDALLATAGQGRILREGVRTVIYGEPNVGKSSLLNALLGSERAIVSAVPGTTRDTVEEFVNVRGLPLRLIDTAGLRDTADAVEAIGIERTRQTLARADLALRVFDASLPRPADAALPAPAPAAVELRVLNKADLGVHPSWQDLPSAPPGVRVSCVTSEGLETLANAIYERVTSGQVAWNPSAAAINARHQDCLRRARAGIEAAREALQAGRSPEFVALDLRLTLDALGEVVGGVDAEDILGRIFSTFCIGK